MGALSFVALLTLAQVVGTPSCPDADAINQRLHALLPSAGSLADRATVDVSAGAIRVEVRDPDGTLLGARALPPRGSCDDRAEAVAVVIAAWESDLAASTSPAFTIARPAAHATAVVATARPRSAALTWDVAAAFLGTFAGGAFAAGASADVTLRKPGFPLAARLGVAGSDSREIALAGGSAGWTRAALLLGAAFDVVSRRGIRFDAHADVAAGWLFVQGRGYHANYSDNAFDPALGGGVRLALTKWDLEPWVDCTLLGWLRHQTVSVSDPTSTMSAEIPRFDVWLRAGVAYGKRRP
ncbi:MAG TPA: hypothetical protein VIA18_03470 [Polyangia bacterium]|nr:hypothetical protein [Polyangia bacterium]